MPSEREFRALLLAIEDDLSDEERKKFVFLLADDVPRRIKDGPLVDIFTELINRGHISKSHCGYLVKIFESMKLLTVAYRIAQFEAQSVPPLPPPTFENTQPLENNSATEDYQNNHSSLMELMNDFNSTDAMTFTSDLPSIGPITPPILEEPSPEIVPLTIENIDLKLFESSPWSDDFLEKIHLSSIRPYEYQRELVQNAIKARNTIICLRAGGKKTFVAALLLKYYLIKRLTSENDKKKFLAFFLVSRRAMLKQQANKLKQIGNLRVVICDEANDATQYVINSDVIVCTPQKLIKCLRMKTILVSNIDVLCFDECHDSPIRSQYIEIMQYILCKNIEQIPPVESPPVIIGLTAIGVHHMNSSQIVPNLANLCATFNCMTMTTVLNKENQEELEQCATGISEGEVICVDKQKDYEKLKSSIEKGLEELILELFINRETNHFRIFSEKDIHSNGYEQSLVLLKESQQKACNFPSVLLLNYILVIYRHLKALTNLTPQMVLLDLKEQFETIYKSREHPLQIDTIIYRKCQSVFKKKLAELEESGKLLMNPKLEKLVDLLKIHLANP
ncbi:unnamed protein product, partial [Adineta ricciae]